MTAGFVDERGQIVPESPAGQLVAALVAGADREPDALVRLLRRHQIAPLAARAVLAGSGLGEVLDAPAWLHAEERNREKAARLRNARDLVVDVLDPLRGRAALSASTLGVAWSSDVDVLVGEDALPEAVRLLLAAGCIDLEPLLARLGRRTADVHRVGAMADGEPQASIELCTRLHDHGPRVDAAVRRAAPPERGIATLAHPDRVRRRCAKIAAQRRATVRGALELMGLAEEGPLPRDDARLRVALQRCAALEQELTGAGRLAELQAGLGAPPNVAWLVARARGARRLAKRVARPRRLTIALSGLDGAGKSTQTEQLITWLGRMDIGAERVWIRIGFGHSAPLRGLVRLLQRLLPSGTHSAMHARASGESSGQHATRRGALGWAWALVVTLDYLRRQRRLAGPRGAVTILDRSLPDAMVGLEVGYGGAVRLDVQRRLLERLGRKADVTAYLRLSAAASIRRKQDMWAMSVLEQNVDLYDRLLLGRDDVVVLDAERPPLEIGQSLLARITSSLPPGSANAAAPVSPGEAAP